MRRASAEEWCSSEPIGYKPSVLRLVHQVHKGDIEMRWLFLLVAFGLHGQTQPCGGPPPGGTEIIKLSGKPFALAETKDGCWIFAAMPVETPGIAVLSRKSGRVQLARTAPMEGRYFGMVLSHDGKMLMVAADERVVFLDVDRL